MNSKLSGAIPKSSNNSDNSKTNVVDNMSNNMKNEAVDYDNNACEVKHLGKLTLYEHNTSTDITGSSSGHSLKSKSTNTCLIEKKQSQTKRPATAFELSAYKSQIPEKVFERLNINDSTNISLLYAGSKSNINVRRFQKD